MTTLKHCVYILFSVKDHKLYTGCTTNLERRLTDHFQGRSKSTAPKRPLKLIFWENNLSQKDAQRREKYFKATACKKTLRLRLRESLKEIP